MIRSPLKKMYFYFEGFSAASQFLQEVVCVCVCVRVCVCVCERESV